MSIKTNTIDISTFPYPPGTPGADFKNNGGKYFHNLSPANKATLDQLAEWVVSDSINLADLTSYNLNDSLLLLRYLRANNFSLSKTKKHMQANIAWRKELNVTELMQQDPEDILGCKLADLIAYLPHWQFGNDKTGRPILYYQMGYLNATGIKNLCGGQLDRMFRYHVWEQEHMGMMCYEQSLKSQTIVETIFVVFDVKGMGTNVLSADFREFMAQMAKIDQDLYPETLGTTQVLNANFVFPLLFNVVKIFLDPITAAKICVHGSKFETVLHERIGAENLPANYHGTLPALTTAVHPYAEAMKLRGMGELVAEETKALANVKVHAENATVFACAAGESEDYQGEETPGMTDGSTTPLAAGEASPKSV